MDKDDSNFIFPILEIGLPPERERQLYRGHQASASICLTLLPEDFYIDENWFEFHTSTLSASKVNNLALDLFEDALNHLDSKSINYHQCTVEQIDINVVVTMPDIPARYKMKSWKQTGIQQDALLLVKNQCGKLSLKIFATC